MHATSPTKEPPPWYRQGWPWFLIALPASAVIGGIVTIVLAVRSADGVVAADYYKRGLAINEELSRTRRAVELGLTAELSLDGLQSGDRIRVRIRSERELPAEATVRLQLLHPGRARADRAAVLARSRVDPLLRSAEYTGTWGEAGDAPAAASWRIVLDTQGWRLDGDLLPPGRSARIGADR